MNFCFREALDIAKSTGRQSDVVDDLEVLAAKQPVALEPLEAELLKAERLESSVGEPMHKTYLGCVVGRVSPHEGHAVADEHFIDGVEDFAADGQHHLFVCVEHSARRIGSQASGVVGLRGPGDAVAPRVDDLKVTGSIRSPRPRLCKDSL